MSLNAQIVAEVIRQRLGEHDASKAARTINLIPQALKATARKIAANNSLRNLLITDKTEATLPCANGKCDLTDGFDEYQFLLEYIDYGQIYANNSVFPLQKQQAQLRNLPTPYSGDFAYYDVEGNILTVIDAPGATTSFNGVLSFAVPYFPLDLSWLPDSEEAETLFLDKLFELVVGQDASEDGEK